MLPTSLIKKTFIDSAEIAKYMNEIYMTMYLNKITGLDRARFGCMKDCFHSGDH